MKVSINNGECLVEKEKGDPYFKHSNWSSAESTFLYHVKNELNKQGYDLIKKRMWKDGHLMDDIQQYLRARKNTKDPSKDICIWNGNYMIFDAGKQFNKEGRVILPVEYGIFNP